MDNVELDDVVLNQNENERIGFGRRFGAYLLDIVFIGIIGTILSSIAGEELVDLFFASERPSAEEIDQMSEAMSQIGSNFDMGSLMDTMLKVGAGTSIGTLLFFVLEGILGQTAGKMLLGIVNTNLDGSRADGGKLWLRSFLKYASTLLALVGGVIGISIIGTLGSIWGFVIFIGFFFAFGDNKQTIHDMIAKTVVSRK